MAKRIKRSHLSHYRSDRIKVPSRIDTIRMHEMYADKDLRPVPTFGPLQISLERLKFILAGVHVRHEEYKLCYITLVNKKHRKVELVHTTDCRCYFMIEHDLVLHKKHRSIEYGSKEAIVKAWESRRIVWVEAVSVSP
jgi:hypothetical protein